MKKRTLFLPLLILSAILWLAVPTSASFTGIAGESITWNIDETTGVMTFSGQGAMEYGEHPPWSDYHRNVVKVVIEEGITTIGRRAFGGFQKLQTVELPDSLRTIGSHAFDGCWNLRTIDISNITEIGDYAFRQSGLSSVTIPDGVTTISDGAFSDCHQLTEVTFHNSITSIGNYAFNWCVKLTSITLPDSVTELGNCAFDGCSALTSFTLSAGLTSLSGCSFSNCTALTSIVIPDNITAIGMNSFLRCTALSQVVLGARVSQVDSTAFDGCVNLAGITVSTANPSLFADRGILYDRSTNTMLKIPQGFSGSYEILPGTAAIAEWVAKECTKLTGISIPGSVKTVSDYAFNDCRSLSSVTLSNGISRIDMRAFTGCSSLAELTIPPSITCLEDEFISYTHDPIVLTFTGNAPRIYSSAFANANAIIYYPGNNPYWNEVEGHYGGDATWIPVTCSSHTPASLPAVAATCTDYGWSEGSQCTVCGEILVRQTMIPAKGHNGHWQVVTPATLDHAGKSELHCLTCGTVQEKVLPQLTPPQFTPIETTVPSTVPEETSPPPSTAPVEATPPATVPEESAPVATVPKESAPVTPDSEEVVSPPTVTSEETTSPPLTVPEETTFPLLTVPEETTVPQTTAPTISEDIPQSHPDTGAPVGIIIAVVAVLLSGGTVTVLTIFKKKRIL